MKKGKRKDEVNCCAVLCCAALCIQVGRLWTNVKTHQAISNASLIVTTANSGVSSKLQKEERKEGRKSSGEGDTT